MYMDAILFTFSLRLNFKFKVYMEGHSMTTGSQMATLEIFVAA